MRERQVEKMPKRLQIGDDAPVRISIDRVEVYNTITGETRTLVWIDSRDEWHEE